MDGIGLKEALQYLIEIGNPSQLQIDGRDYTSLPLKEVKNPVAQPLVVHTLTGLVDYYKALSGREFPDVFFHIKSPTEVSLLGLLQAVWMQRDIFITAKKVEDDDPFRFGYFYQVEDFIIRLQSKFVQDEVTGAILTSDGNITDSNVRVTEDDGISQEIATRSGIRKTIERVSNPVTLRPYRTFPEIEQPSEKFIHRLKSGNKEKNELPSVAFFNADNGLWKLEAIAKIKTWLAERLPVVNIIA
ncbi:MAG: hypothetical protein V1838_04185 [Patescibacteria group bacterium]